MNAPGWFWLLAGIVLLIVLFILVGGSVDISI